jgi:hypothetical protein
MAARLTISESRARRYASASSNMMSIVSQNGPAFFDRTSFAPPPVRGWAVPMIRRTRSASSAALSGRTSFCCPRRSPAAGVGACFRCSSSGDAAAVAFRVSAGFGAACSVPRCAHLHRRQRSQTALRVGRAEDAWSCAACHRRPELVMVERRQGRLPIRGRSSLRSLVTGCRPPPACTMVELAGATRFTRRPARSRTRQRPAQ